MVHCPSSTRALEGVAQRRHRIAQQPVEHPLSRTPPAPGAARNRATPSQKWSRLTRARNDALFPPPEDGHEAHLSAPQYPACAHARLSRSHVHPRWSQSLGESPSQGPAAPGADHLQEVACGGGNGVCLRAGPAAPQPRRIRQGAAPRGPRRNGSFYTARGSPTGGSNRTQCSPNWPRRWTESGERRAAQSDQAPVPRVLSFVARFASAWSGSGRDRPRACSGPRPCFGSERMGRGSPAPSQTGRGSAGAL